MIDPRFAFFNAVTVPRSSLVANAEVYIGYPYTHGRSVVFRDGTGRITSAKFNCLGFVLQVAKDCGMLDQSYNINGPRFDRTLDWEETVAAILDNNFIEIPKDQAGPGDILKMRYTDVDAEAPIHVAIKASWDGCPTGSMIHAINRDIGANTPGTVSKNRIDINEWNRILSAHRFKGIIDG